MQENFLSHSILDSDTNGKIQNKNSRYSKGEQVYQFWMKSD